VVFNRSDEESLTFDVNAEVIDAPFDSWQSNVGIKR
jgi:hypothetical protein